MRYGKYWKEQECTGHHNKIRKQSNALRTFTSLHSDDRTVTKEPEAKASIEAIIYDKHEAETARRIADKLQRKLNHETSVSK
jgi:hypothetical protein